MNVQENNGNILTGRGQVQFGSGQVQSHGQAQSSASSMAVQMLKNKNKPREEIKPVDKERQKVELEKSLESIRRFNRVNEEIKESYDKQDAKLKQKEDDMHESMRKAEANYFPDLDPRSGYTDQSKDLDLRSSFIDQSNDLDQSKDSNLDSDSSDDFVYVQKPKTNRIRREECDKEMTRKNCNRHFQSLKHKKNERMYNRNKIIEEAKDEGIKVTNKDIEQKLDEQYTRSGYTNPEEGIKFCDSCGMYPDNNTAYNKHVTTLKHRNNGRLVTGEIVKNGSKFDCVICKTSLSQYSVDQHLKTKMHLDSVEGKDKIKDKDMDKNITEGYCNICNTRHNNKNEHNESEEHKENNNQKKLVDKKWRDKVNELGLDHNMKQNQIIITSSKYEDPKFLIILESLHNIHPHIKFNTFDVVKYSKPTDDKLEENEFIFRLMTRQNNGAHDLDLLNGELETRMQEQEMNQSGWSMQRFVKRTMYIHRFYPSGGCDTELPFTSRYILNIHNTDNNCLLWCLIAYLHPAPHNPSRVSNYNKPEYINEIKLPIGATPP